MSGPVRPTCEAAAIRSGVAGPPCSKASAPWILAATILGSSITFIDGTVVNVGLPVIQRELRTDISGAQWVVEMYALMLSSLILVGGSLGDRWGRRRVFSLGTLLFAVASGACGLSQTIGQLVAARAVQGIGAAMLVPGSLAIIGATFPKKDRGRAIGTWSGFTSIAAGVGPIIGGWLIQSLSWHWIFLINLPLAAAVLAITWWRVPESRDDTASGLDLAGAALATLGLGGVVYGLIEAGNRGFRDTTIVTSLTAGSAFLAAFLFVERQKGPRAMMPLGLFRSRTFLGANLLTLSLYAALGGLMFFLPFDLIQVQGYSPVEAGAALVPFVVAMFVLSRWAGNLVARHGAKIPLTVGPAVAGLGFAMFMIPGPAAGSYWTSFFPAVMVMSLGMATSVAPLSTTVISSVEERHAGVASGINNSVARTAGLISIAVLGIVMTSVFARDLDRRLRMLDLPAETQNMLAENAGELAAIEQLDLPAEEEKAAAAALRSAFVSGFRIVMLIVTILGLASAVPAFLLIKDERTRS